MMGTRTNGRHAVAGPPKGAVGVPEEELRQLLLCVGEARERAEAGKVALGYTSLMRGILRAERAALDGAQWATELMRCWREIVDDYCERYGNGEAEG